MKIDTLPAGATVPAKYRAPRLEKLGDLRTLTLGGSPGVGESVFGNVPFFPSRPRPGMLPGDADEKAP